MIFDMGLTQLRVGLRQHSGELLARQGEWVDLRPPRRLIVATEAGRRRQAERDAVGILHAQSRIRHAHATTRGDSSEADGKTHAVAILARVIDNWLRDLVVARRDMAR